MLAKFGHQVDVVTSHFKGLPCYEKQDGVRVHRVRCLRRNPCYTTTWEMLTLLWPMYVKALELISRHRYDINHTHFVIPTGVVSHWIYRKTGLPYIITAHGSDIPGYNPNRFQLEHRLLVPYWRRIIRGSRMIISPSHFLKSLIHRKIDAPVAVVNNGFGSSENPADPAGKKNMVLVVTRMFERKGVQYLIEAIRTLKTDWQFVIVGDGPYLPVLRKKAAGLDARVRFTGFIKGKPLFDLYQAAKIFVFPSVMENFPVVLLEAMDSGCALITTTDSGCCEVVGRAAIKVEPRSSAQIRSALDQLMPDEEKIKQLAALARERIAQLAWAQIARQVEALFIEAAARKNPAWTDREHPARLPVSSPPPGIASG
jgi:glycosyltransferase involved in cell wall biosynthesis